MADVPLTVAKATRAVASAANYTDSKTTATNADTLLVPNTGRVVLVVAAATTANIVIARTSGGNETIALADAKVRVLGPFPTRTYNTNAGRMSFTVSADVDVLAVRLP